MVFYDVIQGNPEWYALRRGVPTASAFSRILTPKTRKLSEQADSYIDELIGERLALYLPENVHAYTSNPMRFGQETEEEARRFLALERNLDVTNGGFCMSDCGRWGASPDGLIGEDGALELKCPMAKTHVGYLRGGVLPADYRCQVHGQLIVTGRKWVDFMSYCQIDATVPMGMPRHFLIRVYPDDFTDALRVALELFWEKFQAALARVKSL